MADNEYDIIAEAEAILRSKDSDDLEEQVKVARAKLYDYYLKAAEGRDWESALAAYQWLWELDYIYEYDPEELLNNSLEEWIAKAKKPGELSLCF